MLRKTIATNLVIINLTMSEIANSQIPNFLTSLCSYLMSELEYINTPFFYELCLFDQSIYSSKFIGHLLFL